MARGVGRACATTGCCTPGTRTLTGRPEGNRLSDGQARAACAATLLRWLYAVVTRRQMWDARIAAGTIPARPGAVTTAAAA